MKAAAALALLALAAAADPVPDGAAPKEAHPAPYIEIDGVPVPLPPSGEERPAGPISAEDLDRIGRLAAGVGISAGMTSPDGIIRVLAPALGPADRAALLEFVSDLRDAMESKLGARGATPAEAAAVTFRSDDFRILVRALPDPGGTNLPARIGVELDPNRDGRDWQYPLVVTVFNPANGLDAHVLGDRIVRGLLDLKILAVAWDAADAAVRNGAPGGPILPRPVAPWFAAGLARSLDPETRQEDFDRVRDALAAGRLPPLAQLLAADAPAPAADPALAAQLVEFWLSAPRRPARFRTLCAALGSGTPWSPGLFLATGPGTADADPAAAEKAFEAWAKARSRHVLSPGATTDSLVARTFAAMQLVPGRGGVPEGISDGPVALEKLLEPDAREWAPAAALSLKAEVLRDAIGRGDAYRKACGLFAAFFDEAAKERPDIGVAIPLLREARAALAASGDPAPGAGD